MKSPRLALRWAMVAIALAAIPMLYWSREMNSRRREYLAEASSHERREAEQRRQLSLFDMARRNGVKIEPSALDREPVLALRAAYHAEMRQKYLDAAAQPWKDAPFDPGAPGVIHEPYSLFDNTIKYPDFTAVSRSRPPKQ